MFLDTLFGNNITRKVQKKNRVDGQVEVLKKQQKVQYASICDDVDIRKKDIENATNAQINALQARIASLKVSKEKQLAILDEQRKVRLDKSDNEFSQKIVAKQNLSKRLQRLIEAEQKNIEDVVNPSQPNAPTERKVLNEKVIGFVENKPKTTKKK